MTHGLMRKLNSVFTHCIQFTKEDELQHVVY